MSDGHELGRRELLAAGAALLVGPTGGPAASRTEAPGAERLTGPPRIRQAVCRWPYGSLELAAFLRLARAAGCTGTDLLHADEWAAAADAGVPCVTGSPTRRRSFLVDGFADPAIHPVLWRELEAAIPAARAAGVGRLVVLSGNRRGRADAEGIAHCVAGLRRLAPLAEQEEVTLVLEPLNSRVDHADQFADTTAIGAAIVDGVGSPRVRLLYDVYHMQVMEGNVIATLRANLARIAHVHTAGVPGRHELDGGQELQYSAIAWALAEAGYDGWIAHEFIPTRDALAGLREAVAACSA